MPCVFSGSAPVSTGDSAKGRYLEAEIQILRDRVNACRIVPSQARNCFCLESGSPMMLGR